jgi:hypothetical protein
MRHHLSITVNGEPRDEVALSVAEPLVGLADLTLEFNREQSSNLLGSLYMSADDSDYSDGTYHFQRWRTWPQTTDGVYRARGVTLRFRDGHCVEVPLADHLIVEVRPPAAEELPVFSIR